MCTPPRLCLQLASLLLPLRRALHLLSQYKAREALAALGQLAPAQLGSAGVLLLVGRCQYELVDYARAGEAFEAARAADPLNLEVWWWLCCAAAVALGALGLCNHLAEKPVACCSVECLLCLAMTCFAPSSCCPTCFSCSCCLRSARAWSCTAPCCSTWNKGHHHHLER